MTTRSNSKSKLSRQQQELLRKRLSQRKNRIPRQPHDGIAPASLTQSRLWLENELVPQSVAYNIARRLQLNGRLHIPALEKSLNYIIQRHETVRTTFSMQDDQVTQKINSSLILSLPIHDLTGFSATEREKKVDQLAREEAKRPFALTTGSLIRAKLLRLTETEHILLFALHHIIADGWSMNIFMRDLTHAYQAYVVDLEPPQPPLSIQYADFAHWQEQRLQSPSLQKQREYWLNQLNQIPVYLDLPTDRPRPTPQSFQGTIISFTLPATLTASLKKLSQQQGATLFMTLLAAFEILLARYSGQKDIVVGTPVAGRNHPDLENLIGFFANTVVLRGRLENNPTFCDFLGQTREVVMGALSNQEMPFSQLVSELKPERNLSHSPLFQVIFTLQNIVETAIDLPSLTCHLAPVHSDTAKYDLSLFATETEDSLICTWEYNTALFDQTTIQRTATNLETLLIGIVGNPDQPVMALPLLAEETRQQQLNVWNDTDTAYPQKACVHHLFETQAVETPQQTALIFENEQISYGELNRRANQLAHHLRSLGVGSETLVGLNLERSVEMIVSILAILKTGGAYLPLDAAFPPERLTYMLEEAQVSVLLTQESLRNSVPISEGVTQLCLDSEWEQVSAKRADNLIETAVSSNLAYVMYTSGSTGLPKGVAITHQNIICLVKGANYANLSADETFLQYAPLAFDAATLEIWGSLLNGARLVIAPPHKLSLTELTEFIQAQRITTLWLTAGLFHLVVDDHLANLRGIRQLLAGGDVLAPARVKRVLCELPHCLMINGYGPTENTTFTTCHAVTSSATLDTTVPIGSPVSNTQVYVLDENLELLPIGVPGELYISGDGLARGYLNQPGLTAVSFIPHPFATKPGERLYRTGDMVRWLHNGRLEFLGRRDNQVKIRGYRVELGEIETILSQQPDVRQTVVRMGTSTTGEKYLTAYVLPEKEGSVTDTLQQYLAQRLPNYMVPTAWVMMTEFPLTPNGKIDRQALPDPDLSQRQIVTLFMPPTTPTEIGLAAIWIDVLGIEKIGIHDNFFELGGHSLLATKIVTRIQAWTQQDVPLLTIFQCPTIAGLIEALALAPDKAAAAIINTPINTALREQTQQTLMRAGNTCVALPVSYAQSRLLSLDQLEPDSPLYNVPLSIEIQGKLDTGALKKALTDLVARHESLRTTFEIIDDLPMQIIHPPARVKTTCVDGLCLPAIDIEHQITVAARRPFDLATGPLFRASLYQLQPDKHTLLVVLHHIIADGWSMTVLMNELITFYEAHIVGKPVTLAPLSIQYADYALWQKQQLQGELLETSMRYWRQQLADVPATLNLLTDYPRSPLQSYDGGYVWFEIPAHIMPKLHQLSQQFNLSVNMITLTTFFILLQRYTGQKDIVVGSPSSNRTSPEQEALIGFFVNMLVLRADLSGKPTVAELLIQVRDTVVAARENQDVPFEKLIHELGVERTLSQNPLFQVSFAYDTAIKDTFKQPNLTWALSDVGVGLAKYDLSLGLRETGTGLKGVVSYNSDLFKRDTIQRIADHFVTLLGAVLTQPDHPIATLPLLKQAEQQQLLVAGHGVKFTLGEVTVSRLFEEQVGRTPDALALATMKQTALPSFFLDAAADMVSVELTYAELNGRANQLAYHLIQLGAGTETAVAVYRTRSAETLICMLAVFKTGGILLPLDAAAPPQRVAHILAEAAPVAIITESPEETWPGIITVCPEHEAAIIATHTSDNLDVEIALENSAYLIYTSGTTGLPKGVLVPHRALLNHCQAIQEQYAFTGADRVLQFAALSFDVALEEIFPTWLAGAALIMRPLDVPALDEFTQFIADERLTVINIPAPYWHEWTAVLAQTSLFTMPDSLRLVIVGSSKVSSEKLAQWHELGLAGVQLLNGYGPTETTITASLYLANDVDKSLSLVPIGRMIDNMEAYVLDENGQLCPIGVIGELHLGGKGLAYGYLNQPRQTAEAFIPHYFSNQPGARLYRTGDLVRWLPDGNLAFVGRADHQVKIRGFRIELEEVETCLARHDGVRQTAVIADDNNQRLIAYVVLNDLVVTTRSLQIWLEDRLPDYMIPSAFVTIPELPHTRNGKIDRDRLPAPAAISTKTDSYVAPKTDIEKTLVTIWEEMLSVTPIGMDDNFFELGGDSILSIRIIAKAKAVGLHVTMRQLFQRQTIAELADVVEIKTAVISTIAVTTDPTPLTPIQHWFFDHDFAQPNHWNMALLLKMEQPLERHLLEQTLAHLLAHHDALRMQFKQTDAGWQQINALESSSDIVCWITAVDDITPIIVAQQASLDLTTDPLVRAVYFDHPNQPHHLLVVVHHLVMDGISWRILLEDFQTVYHQLKEGTAVSLPHKTTSFQAWAQTLNSYVNLGNLQLNTDYWLEMAAAQTHIPRDFPDGENSHASEASLSFSLTPEETKALLHDVHAAYNTTTEELLLTALAQAYRAWTGKQSLQIALEGHGREEIIDHVDISRTIGWFTSLYPVHLNLSDSAHLDDDIKAVKEQVRQIPNRGMDYGLGRYLSSDLNRQAQLSQRDTTEIGFNYLGQFNEQKEDDLFSIVAGGAKGTLALDNRRTHMLDVSGLIHDRQLRLQISYSRNIHKQETIAQLGKDWADNLRTLITHCQTPAAQGYTPSDFAKANLSQGELDDVLAELDDIF